MFVITQLVTMKNSGHMIL